uniref:Uncharacterized protein n=1 Tax=Arundo donax TaxID=35708 RepID=A0A0A9C8T5_ARUDO
MLNAWRHRNLWCRALLTGIAGCGPALQFLHLSYFSMLTAWGAYLLL